MVDPEPSSNLQIPANPLLIEVAGVTVNDTVLETLPAVATTDTVCCVVTLPVVAVNEAVAELAGTVTDAGTVTALLPLVRLMPTPPVGAGPLMVTEQLLVLPEAMLVGLHERLLSTTAGATIVRLADTEAPLNVVVTLALWLAEALPTSTVKLAEADPEGMLMGDGTVRMLPLPDVVTLTPLDGATAVKVTTQTVEPGAVMLFGVHVKPLRLGGAGGGGRAVTVKVAVAFTVPAELAAVKVYVVDAPGVTDFEVSPVTAPIP